MTGKCRYCGCTEDRACRRGDGDACGWVTQLRDRCNAEACMRAFAHDQAAYRSELRRLQKIAAQAPTPGQLAAARIRDRRSRKKRRVA